MKSSEYLEKLGIKHRDRDSAWEEIGRVSDGKRMDRLVRNRLSGSWYTKIGKPTKDYYNGIGGQVYEILQSGMYEVLAKDLDGMASEFKGVKRILDAGCGTGVCSCWLACNYADATVEGVDFSSKMLERAEEHKKKLGLANVTFRKGDIAKLPFKTGHFDAALCISTLFETEPDVTLNEISRTLAMEGKIYADSHWSGHAAEKEASVEETTRLFRDAGFDVSVSYSEAHEEEGMMECILTWKGKKVGKPKPIKFPYAAAMQMREQF